MVKERYKDGSLDIADAGEKVKALINEHLIDLGINPKIPPVELLSDDFVAHVQKHSKDNPEAKASEMEHAIRKHCTVHFDEDPAFYSKLSEKLEKLIERHRDNWKALADDLEQLRKEAIEGRTEAVEGLTKEATTFYDYLLQLAYGGAEAPLSDRATLKKLILRIVDILQDTIDILDFWKKPIEVRKLRGNIDTEILLANIPALSTKHERLAVELVKLAEKRHKEPNQMKAPKDKGIAYEVVRSHHSTAAIVIERDGRVLVRAPEWVDYEQVANIVESKHYWIYQGLAEWRDLNATRVLREYKNGEGFLYLGRPCRLSLSGDQTMPLQLKDGRFMLRRDLVERGDIAPARAAFCDFDIAKGFERLRARVAYNVALRFTYGRRRPYGTTCPATSTDRWGKPEPLIAIAGIIDREGCDVHSDGLRGR